MNSYEKYLNRKRKKVGLIESGFAGIGSGLLKIPEGIVSLGAELIDLGLGTNKAAEVEDFFDEINVFEDKAEARVTGRLTSILAQFGLPGAQGFKLGSQLATKALNAKKAGKYLTPKKLMGGIGGAGLAEALVTTDAPEVSFLARPVEGEGRQAAFDRLVNRSLVGVESAAIGAVPIGGIALFKKAQRRALDKRAFDIQEMGNLNLFDKILIGLSKEGHLSPEGYKVYREFVTGRRGELAEAQQTANALSDTLKNIGRQAFSSTDQGKKNYDIFKKKLFKAMQDNEEAVDKVFSTIKAKKEDVKAAKDLIRSGQDQIKRLGKTLYETFEAKKGQNFPGMEDKKFIMPDNLEGFMKAVEKTASNEGEFFLSNFYKIFERNKGGAYAGWRPHEEHLDEIVKLATETEAANHAKNLANLPKVEQAFQNAVRERLTVQKAVKEGKATTEELAKANSKVEKLNNKLLGLKSRTENYVPPTRDDILKKLNLFQEHADAAVTEMKQASNKPFSKTTYKNVTYADIERYFNKVLTEQKGMTPQMIEARKKALGLIDDPAEALFLTVQKLTNQTLKNKYFDDIAAVGQREGWIIPGDGSLRAPEAPVRLTEIVVDKKDIDALLPNDLVGKYTTPDIAKALGLNSRTIDSNMTQRLFEGLVNYAIVLPKAVSSLSKTVLNPPTQIRNFVAGGFFAANSGNFQTFGRVFTDPEFAKKTFGTAFQPTLFRKLFGADKKPLTPEEIKSYAELVRRGVFNTSVRVNEVRDAFSKDLKEIPNLAAQIAAGNVPVARFLGGLKQTVQGFENVYQASDDFFKLITYTGETGKATKILDELKRKGMNVDNFTSAEYRDTISQLVGRDLDFLDTVVDPNAKRLFFDDLDKEIAANVARNAVPNYDYTGMLVRALRKAPIGNFMSFPSEIIRTSIYNLERGLLERRLGKQLGIKALDDIGTQRLFAQAATSAMVPAMVPQLSKIWFGYTQDEMDAAREFVPPWSKNSVLMMGPKDKDGNATYIDFSHAFPYDTIYRPVQTILNNLSKLDSGQVSIAEVITKSYVDSTAEMLNPFIAPSIYTAAVNDILFRGGETREGKRVFNFADSPLEKATKSSVHVLNSLTPGFAQLTGAGELKGSDPIQKLGVAGYNLLTGNSENTVDKFGRAYNPMNEIAGIAGFKINTVDPKDSMQYMISGFQDNVRNSTASFTSEILSGKPKPVSKIISEYNQTQSSRFDAYKEMYKKVKAAQVLGLTDREILQSFGDRLTAKDQAALLTGKFRPYAPSENVILKAAQNAANTRSPNTFNEALPSILKIAQGINAYDLEAPNPFKVATTTGTMGGPSPIPQTTTQAPNIVIPQGGGPSTLAQSQAEKYASLFPTDISGINIASRSNK